MCRIRWGDMANDQEIVQHPHCSEFLLNGRFGPRKVLNPSSHMERSHSLEFQAVRAAPFKKLPARPSVSSPSVPVADRGGEEVNVGFSDLRTGSGNQLRDPRARRRAGNDRKFSHGNEFHMSPLLYHIKDVMFYKRSR